MSEELSAPAAALATPAMNPAECARRLAELFPALFGGPPKPMKLRVHADIQARAPGLFGKPVLAAFMRRHTGSTAYLQAVVRGTQRFGLDGEPAGEISDEHRQAAVDELARRRARHAQQRAEEEQARRARQALLRDFERTTLTEANFCALKGIAPHELAGLLEQARSEAREPPPARDGRGPHGPHAAAPRRDRDQRPPRVAPPRR
jgi:sRNA-binding protein